MLNLTWNIENNFKKCHIRSVVLIDCSVAISMVNHCIWLWILYNLTKDFKLIIMWMLHKLMENCCFQVDLGGKCNISIFSGRSPHKEVWCHHSSLIFIWMIQQSIHTQEAIMCCDNFVIPGQIWEYI